MVFFIGRSDIQAEYENRFIKDRSYRMRTEDGKTIIIPFEESRQEWEKRYGKKKTATIGPHLDPIHSDKAVISQPGKETNSFTIHRSKHAKRDIWHEKGLRNANKLSATLERKLNHIAKKHPDVAIPRMVIVNAETMYKNYAAYDRESDVIYVSNESFNEKWLEAELERRGFAATNFQEMLLHELGHKAHWDAARRFYKEHKNVYNSLAEAKKALEKDVFRILNSMPSELLTTALSEHGKENWDTNEPYAEWYLRWHLGNYVEQNALNKAMRRVFRL